MQGFDHYAHGTPEYLAAVSKFVGHVAALFDLVFQREDGPLRLQQYANGDLAFRLHNGALELCMVAPDVVVPDDASDLE